MRLVVHFWRWEKDTIYTQDGRSVVECDSWAWAPISLDGVGKTLKIYQGTNWFTRRKLGGIDRVERIEILPEYKLKEESYD